MIMQSDALGVVDQAVGVLAASDDDDGLIAYVNRTAEEMFGYFYGQMIGMPAVHLIPQRIREAHPEYKKLFRIQPGFLPLSVGIGKPLTVVRRNGSEFPVSATLCPARQYGKDYLYAIITELPIDENGAVVPHVPNASKSGSFKAAPVKG